MTFEQLAAWLPLLVLLVVPGWSVGKLVAGLRRGDWRRPGWFGHLAWASFLLMVLAWFTGLFAGGLQWQKTCSYVLHQPYDDAYYSAHRADYLRLFPLSRHCNADYDLVPAWVNPAVVGFLLLLLVGLGGLAWTAAQRQGRSGRERAAGQKRTAGPERAAGQKGRGL